MAQPLINVSRQKALLFAGFLVMYEFLTYIANDMIMPGMLQVVKTFHGVEADISLSLSVYILGGATLQIFLGPLSDRFGRRPVMLIGAVLFFVFTSVIACSSSMDMFLSMRFFQGMGLCFISVIGYATLQEIFAEMDVIRLMAIMGNVSILAPLLGPLAGAVFVSYFSWRYIFVIVAIFSLIALVGLWRFMPESVGETKRDGTLIPRVSLAPKVVFGNYFNLLTNPVFVLGSVAFGMVGLPCVVWIALAPVVLVSVGDVSLLNYGFWQLPMFTATIIGNMVLHRLTHSLSLKQMLMLGTATICAGLFLSCALAFCGHGDFRYLLPGLLVYFFGMGIAGSPMSRFVLFSTPVSKGTAAALMSMILMTVQAIGIQIAHQFYLSHDNAMLGFYLSLVGVAFAAILGVAAYLNQRIQTPVEEASHA